MGLQSRPLAKALGKAPIGMPTPIASTAAPRPPVVSDPGVVRALGSLSASLVERDGATITVSSLVEWEQAGSPLIDRSLVHDPPLEVSLARRRLILDSGNHGLERSVSQSVHLPEASSTRGLSGRPLDESSMVVDEHVTDEPAHDRGPLTRELESDLVDIGQRKLGRLIATRVRKGKLVESVLDVRSVGYCDKDWIVSRKKTRNLGDIVNSWKNSLLKHSSDDDVVGMFVDEWQ